MSSEICCIWVILAKSEPFGYWKVKNKVFLFFVFMHFFGGIHVGDTGKIVVANNTPPISSMQGIQIFVWRAIGCITLSKINTLTNCKSNIQM